MFSLTALLILGWEAVLGTVAFGLLNGGTAGLIYDYIAVAILFMLVNVSMAEMASMAPTSGGQVSVSTDLCQANHVLVGVPNHKSGEIQKSPIPVHFILIQVC